MDDSWNLEKLPDDVQRLIAFAFAKAWIGWTLCYMIEVRLDAPVRHMLEGGEGVVFHGGNGSRHYAKHYGDPDWAVVHCEDPAWTAMAISDG